MQRWVTINGHHVLIKSGKPQPKTNVHQKQLSYESKIRNNSNETGAFIDAEGNIVLESLGNSQEVTFDPYEMNHKVEQAIWDNKELHFTHNHPENTIFSPEDVYNFEQLENKSLSAILPNGINYRLFREQDITSNEWIIDTKSGEMVRRFEPRKIAETYDKEYSKLYDEEYDNIRATTKFGTPERKAAEQALDKKVAEEMEKWLHKNAKEYGYRFERN